jgi:N-acetylglutamate synthase-like GNAT family acetyltransferase
MVTESSSAPRAHLFAHMPLVSPGAVIGSSGGLLLRHARDEDSTAIIGLVSRVWSEYPGKVLVAATDMPELLRPASAYARCDGRFWVIEANGQLIGTVALKPSEEAGVAELQKLYVARDVRNNGLGGFLCDLVEREARERGDHAIELWSDVKLLDAHRRYEALGYRRSGEIRKRDDTSKTVQYYYRKSLEPAAERRRARAEEADRSDWDNRWQALCQILPQVENRLHEARR